MSVPCRFVRHAASTWAASLLFLGSASIALAQRNLAVAPAEATEQRVALVIGNSAYKDSPLKNPVNDATDIAAVLKELGFKVVLRTNANYRQMKDAIREFGSQLEKGGVGLFYFAGHGLQFKGQNFLVPVGANIEREAHIEDDSVNAAFVLALMEEARNRVNIVILDACRNNPFVRGSRSASRGLAQMDAATGSLVAFATAPGSVAADGEGRNGIYTKHLLQQLRVPGVPVELMLKRVRNGVIEETKERQTPWESSSLRGSDFYFRPGAPAASVAPVVDPVAPELQKVRQEEERLALEKTRLEEGKLLREQIRNQMEEEAKLKETIRKELENEERAKQQARLEEAKRLQQQARLEEEKRLQQARLEEEKRLRQLAEQEEEARRLRAEELRIQAEQRAREAQLAKAKKDAENAKNRQSFVPPSF